MTGIQTISLLHVNSGDKWIGQSDKGYFIERLDALRPGPGYG